MKRVFIIIAAVVLFVCFTSFVIAADNGPVYEPLLAAESLEEFRGILLNEGNRGRVMDLTAQEIAELTSRVEYLYAKLADPTDDETYYWEEMKETLSILPNGPEELYGDPTTYADFTSALSGTEITSDVTYYLKSNVELNSYIMIKNGATLTIINETGSNYTISRSASNTSGLFFVNDIGGKGKLTLNGKSGKIILSGTGSDSELPMVRCWGYLNFTNVTLQNNHNLNRMSTYTTDVNELAGAIGIRSANGATQTFTNCTFSNNKGNFGGAVGIENNSNFNVTFTNCSFTNNHAATGKFSNQTVDGGRGGAICVSTGTATVNVAGCTFTSNTADNRGGALYLYSNDTSHTYTIETSTFNTNAVVTSAVGGGAIDFLGHGDIKNCTFDGNSAKVGSSHAGTLRVDPNGTINVESCIIRNSMSGNGSVLYVHGNKDNTVYLKKSLIYNCSYGDENTSGDGGTLRTYGAGGNNLYVQDTVIRNNTNIRGAAAYWNANNGGTLTFDDCQLLNNEVTTHGGAIYMEGKNLSIIGSSGTMTGLQSSITSAPSGIVGTRIYGNTAAEKGGAICFHSYNDQGSSTKLTFGQSTITMGSNVRIESNSAAKGGAIAFNLLSSTKYPTEHKFIVNINGSTILNNTASGNGGAIYMDDESTNMTNANGIACVGYYIPTVNFTSGTIKGNSAAGYGGAVYAECGSFVLNGGTFDGNHANYGGAFSMDGSAAITGKTYSTAQISMQSGTIKNNYALNGGAVHIKTGKFTMSDGTVGGSGTPNRATGNGGGAFRMDGGSLYLNGGVVSYNTANSSGGAVQTASDSALCQIAGATITQNTAGVYGGGICVYRGTCTVNSGTISYNSAAQGGGIKIEGGTANINGGTISNNLANVTKLNETTYNGYGGGICVTAGTCNIKSGTISTNTASNNGGGFYSSGGTTNIGLDTCKGTNGSHGHPAFNSNTAGTTESGWAGYGAGFGITGGTVNTYCCNLNDNYCETYLRQNSSSVYHTNGTVNWYGGNMDIGMVVDNSKFNVMDGAAKYSITYHVNYDEAATGDETGGYDTTIAVVRGNSVVLPAGNRADMNFQRYKQMEDVKFICLGWAPTEADADNLRNYTPVGTTITAANTTLYAVWTRKDNNTITYDYAGGTNGSSNPTSYTITPGAANAKSITISKPTKTGYTFAGWTVSAVSTNNWPSSLGTGTTVNVGGYYGSVKLTAKWTANTNTKYVVKHWQQNIDAATTQNSTNYTLKDTDNLTGTTATNVTPATKSYTGFTAPAKQTVSISADGSRVVNYYYTRNSYKVTLSSGTGISAVSGAGTYHYGKNITINATVKAGYTWKDWTGSSTQTTKNYSFTVSSAVNFTANATANTYYVKFNANSGTGTMSNQTFTYDAANKALTQNVFTRTGYTFAGWNTAANGSGTSYTNQQAVSNLTTTANGTVNLYAQWTPITYNVKFNANGGSGTMSNQKHTYASSLALTANAFTRTGYTFAGWDTSSNGTNVVYANKASVTNLSSSSGATVNLYAVWTPNNNTAYKVQHWQQNLGAANTQNSTNYTLRETDNLTGTTAASVTPTRKSYNGFTAPSAQTVTIAADGSTVVDYYYTRNSYTVTLENGAGIATVIGAGSYQYGASVTINASVAPGYAWSKWSGTHDINAQQYTFTMPANNVTDTANATAVKYTVSYDLNGGTVAAANPTEYYVTTSAIKLNNPTKTGYTFAGWTGTGLDGASTSVTIAQGSTGNRAYTATWTEHKYNIVFNANGGDGTMSNLNPSYTQSLTLTTNAFTRNGYTFTGWNTEANGTGTSYAAGATVSKLSSDNNATVTMYAQWKVHTYLVQFNANGGSGAMADQLFTYGVPQYLTANEFTRTGYIFSGWTTVSDGTGNAYIDGAEVVSLTAADNGKIILYARWTPITYTIQFLGGDGSGSMATMTVRYDQQVNLTANEFTRAGYKFVQWSGSDGQKYADQALVVNLTTMDGDVITLTALWEMASNDFTVYVSGLANGQSAVIKIFGTRADGTPFKDFSFAVVGNGNTVTSKLSGLPVGNYTITVAGNWTWRYDGTAANVDTSNPANNSVTITFTGNDNVKWLNAYGQKIN